MTHRFDTFRMLGSLTAFGSVSRRDRSIRALTRLVPVAVIALAACSTDSVATTSGVETSTTSRTATGAPSSNDAQGEDFSFLIIDRCASVRPVDPDDTFTDENGVAIEASLVATLGVTVSSQTPPGSGVSLRLAQEPRAEPQQVRTVIVEPDRKLLAEFGIDPPGPYLLSVGGATAPDGGTGSGSFNLIIEVPDDQAVCDKATLDETSSSTTVP